MSGLGPYLAELTRRSEPADVLLGGLVRHLGADWDGEAALPPGLVPPPDLAGPDLLGQAHEALTAPDERRRGGVHYTPRPVAERLVAIALEGADPPVTVCDPAVGGGAFLLAAGRALADRGVDPLHAVARLLWGIDLEPLAVEVTRAALSIWSAGPPPPPEHVRVGDGLASPQDGEGFDVVIGNPPFQSQMFAATARSQADRDRLPPGVGPYTDTAALFLLTACGLANPHGRVVLIQPQSVLASRDAEGVRDAVAEVAALEGLWVSDQAVFQADTRVCAPVLRVGVPQPKSVARWWGPSVEATSVVPAAPWSSLAASLRGVPSVALQGRPLADLTQATAGFRQQFYGLIPFVHESSGREDERPRLVTSGLVDPGVCRWGERSTIFARTRFEAPVVDMEALDADDPALSVWVRARLGPKVLVATQTRVIEAVADETGVLVPSTPVISVAVEPDRLWAVAAVLLAPPVTAWALHRASGAALAADALKLSARQVREIPEPTDRGAWSEGADLAQALHRTSDKEDHAHLLRELGVAMTAAYEVAEPDELIQWWAKRLPR